MSLGSGRAGYGSATVSTAQVKITSNADFEVEYRVRGLWGTYTASETIRPSQISSTQNRVERTLQIYPTTLKLVGTVRDSNNNPSLRAYLRFNSPSIVREETDLVDNQGRYELYVMVRDGYVGGQLIYQTTDYYSQLPDRIYPIEYNVTNQGGQLITLTNDFLCP